MAAWPDTPTFNPMDQAMDQQNFEMFQGDSKDLVVTVSDAAGQPVDLTGASIKWRAAPAVDSAVATISKATGSGIVITDAVAGEFTVSLVPADTQTLDGEFYHEAQVTDAAGAVSTVLSGHLTILPALIGD